MASKISNEKIQEAYELYKAGNSYAEIGRKLNINSDTISKHLRNTYGIKTKDYSKKMDQTKFEQLWNEGKTDQEIADIMGVAYNTVKSFRTRGKNAGKFVTIRNFSQTEQHLTHEQEQFILGSLLGDLNLSTPSTNRSKNSRLAIVHSIKQKELFMKKVELLGEFMGSWRLQTPPPDKRTGKIYQTYRGNSKAHGVFTEIWKLVYPDGHKKITKEYLDRIDSPIALAYWFMDDGTYSGTFATNSFSEEENDRIIDWMWNKWNIKCTKQQNIQSSLQYIIHISNKSRRAFEELIFPYVIPEMYYKLKYANDLMCEVSVKPGEFRESD